jgi:hypothetical protein
MRKTSLTLLGMLVFCALRALPQSEHLNTKAQVSIGVRHCQDFIRADGSIDTLSCLAHVSQISLGIAPEERIVLRNVVTETARHCAKYALPSGGVDASACAADSSTIFYTHTDHNLVTNAGGDWAASVMGNTAAPPATATYIAVSNDATAPATSDTALAAEITTNGLARAQATYSHTTGTSSYTEEITFTATGTQSAQKAGMFNASTGGTLVFENVFPSLTLRPGGAEGAGGNGGATGDTLTISWSCSF